jgi:hypothetical protein
VELATAVLLTFLFVTVLIGYQQLRREARETRHALVDAIRVETQRLERKVDTFTHASSTAHILAQHAVTSAGRAEKHAVTSAEHARDAAARARVSAVSAEETRPKRTPQREP